MKNGLTADVIALCITCESKPDRLPCTGYMVHKRLYRSGTMGLGRIENLQCTKCGTRKTAYRPDGGTI